LPAAPGVERVDDTGDEPLQAVVPSKRPPWGSASDWTIVTLGSVSQIIPA
jgi:hypothetical protein